MTIRNVIAGTIALSVLVLAACGDTDEQGEMDEAPAAAATGGMAAAPDTTGSSVWNYLQEVDYRSSWQLWPEKGRLYTGQEPHGMLLTTYLNDVALGALEGQQGVMPAGAIIVKENYMPDSALAAVTVMYKVPGYNAEHADWFFTKHLPDGRLDVMPNGGAMEGRVPGCQNCHMGVRDNDYVFTGGLSATSSQ